MSDEALRDLERRFRATGAHTDEVAWLAARLRAGTLDAKRLAIAAQLGHPAALALSGVAAIAPPLEDPAPQEPGPDRLWWDPRGWFAREAPRPAPPTRRPHLGRWLDEVMRSRTVELVSFELLALRAASGLARATGHTADERDLVSAAQAHERRLDSWNQDPSRGEEFFRLSHAPGVSARTAALLERTSDAIEHFHAVYLHLQAQDRPAALESANGLDEARSAMSEALQALAGPVPEAERVVREAVVPWLLR